MSDPNRQQQSRSQQAVPKVKIVAEMPQDDEVQKKLKDWKETDGYPGSCGV
ncbi:hypothetical protein [Cohnella pontilimi]|uniref:hypothetical protein n=1 Tax=Cohnella pontilimi TaxID=2564100 RepID=UPI00145DB776|nr:hypothetical protein [Cohnella pontilimi]